MIYNAGWGNLKPQELKYTAALAAKAAKLLQSGESLTATARSLNISRTSLRNWRDRDPKLNEAFGTFEVNKTKAEADMALLNRRIIGQLKPSLSEKQLETIRRGQPQRNR